METLHGQGVITHFCSIEDVRVQIQHLPKQERYFVSLEYCTENDLHHALLLGGLLKRLGAGANVLINAYTHPMALDFLTHKLNETVYSVYISSRF